MFQLSGKMRDVRRQAQMSFVSEHLAGRPEDVRSLYEQCGVEFPYRFGRKGRVSCVWHRPDRSPAMSVNTEAGIHFCFRCNRGGDVVNLYAEQHSMSEADAVRAIKRRLGIGSSRKCEWNDEGWNALRKRCDERNARELEAFRREQEIADFYGEDASVREVRRISDAPKWRRETEKKIRAYFEERDGGRSTRGVRTQN